MGAVRGVRGAITASKNSREEILRETRRLLEALLISNDLMLEDIAAAFFTVTDDIDAAFPAAAARELGWKWVPLMCSREIAVPGSLPMCIRVMLLVNTDLESQSINHVYLGEAAALRPDLPDSSGDVNENSADSD